MTFGGHEYGPGGSDDEEDIEEEEDVETLPPDHPASVEQCDHYNCPKETPRKRQRICDDCDQIMLPDNPDECDFCGSSIID